MFKLVNIVGARPQFVKATLICKKLREGNIQDVLVHTGQHYDFNMSDIFFRELDIPTPDYYLGVGSGGHGEQTGKMLMEIEKVLIHEKPDCVLVYGDTNTTLAGALAASKLHIPIAHVESGLRSFNKLMPEEINRIVADHTSSVLFCPSKVAIINLQKEGFAKIANNGDLIESINNLSSSVLPLVANVGDIMFDLAEIMRDTIDSSQILDSYGLTPGKFILVTIHRPENADNHEKLQAIWDALTTIAHDGFDVFYPIHPRTRKKLQDFEIVNNENKDLLKLAEPISYREMLGLESNARLIITDSGGVQKESYFARVPCVIRRDQTEWVELVESGWSKLARAETTHIVETVYTLLNDQSKKPWIPFYGDGKAVDRIIGILKAVLF